MKSKILKNILIFIGINFLIFLHLNWRNNFGDPIRFFNILMAVFLWLIIYNPRKHYNIFLALYSFLICELFYNTPFGIESFSQIITLLFMNWVLLNVFTNRSTIIVFLTGIVAMIFYRLLFIVLLFLNSSFHNYNNFDIFIYTKIFWNETIITTGVLTLFYLISSIFVKRLHPEYVINTTRLI